MTTFTLDVPAATLRGVLLAAAKKDRRSYLCGVCIDTTASAPLLVGTDGNILLATRLPSQADPLPAGRYILPRYMLELVPKTAEHVTVSVQGVMVTLAWHGKRCQASTTTAALTDGTYPDWPRVVPDAPDGTPAQVDPALLQRLHDAFKLCGASQPRVYWGGEPASLLMSEGGTDTVGVLMPLHEAAVPRATEIAPRARLGLP